MDHAVCGSTVGAVAQLVRQLMILTATIVFSCALVWLRPSSGGVLWARFVGPGTDRISVSSNLLVCCAAIFERLRGVAVQAAANLSFWFLSIGLQTKHPRRGARGAQEFWLAPLLASFISISDGNL